ncbi:MAG: hypothetical protein ACREH6_14735 [Geminicoccaceae bacterium]
MTSLARMVAIGLCGLWVAACAQMEQSSVWELAGHPGLLLKVKQYYERNALEQGGYCPRPLLEGVTNTEVLSETPEQLVVGLTYYYRDAVKECEEDDPLVCTPFRACKGFAQRTFTIAKQGDALSVAGMSGQQRHMQQ